MSFPDLNPLRNRFSVLELIDDTHQEPRKLVQHLPKGQIHPLTQLFSNIENVMSTRVPTLLQLFPEPAYADKFGIIIRDRKHGFLEHFEDIIAGVSEITRKFPHAFVQGVDLDIDDSTTPEQHEKVAQIAERFPALEILTINNDLRWIEMIFPRTLKVLTANACDRADLSHIAACCPNLTHLIGKTQELFQIGDGFMYTKQDTKNAGFKKEITCLSRREDFWAMFNSGEFEAQEKKE